MSYKWIFFLFRKKIIFEKFFCKFLNYKKQTPSINWNRISRTLGKIAPKRALFLKSLIDHLCLAQQLRWREKNSADEKSRLAESSDANIGNRDIGLIIIAKENHSEVS